MLVNLSLLRWEFNICCCPFFCSHSIFCHLQSFSFSKLSLETLHPHSTVVNKKPHVLAPFLNKLTRLLKYSTYIYPVTIANTVIILSQLFVEGDKHVVSYLVVALHTFLTSLIWFARGRGTRAVTSWCNFSV